MTVALNTVEAFNGRMYAKEDPLGCETLGRSQTVTSLTLPLSKADGRCAVKEEVGGPVACFDAFLKPFLNNWRLPL